MNSSGVDTGAEREEENSRTRTQPLFRGGKSESDLMTQAGNPEDGKRVYPLRIPIDGDRYVDGYVIMPQHTEQTFADEILSTDLKHNYPPHQTLGDPGKCFKHIKALGSGSFGVVDEIESNENILTAGSRYVRKSFFKSQGFATVDSIWKQIEIAKSICHEHIVSVKMTYDHNLALQGDVEYATITGPVADCNLQEYMERTRENRHPGDTQKRDNLQKWFSCLSSGLAYLHAKGIRHENIAPSNIFVKDNQIFYADFGLSKELRDLGDTTESNKSHGSYASLYWAPEVEANQASGRKADIFSLGCVFTEILTVLAGLTLEDFMSWRGDPGRQAYCYNLHRISLWTTKILEQLSTAYLRGVLLCAMDMLNYSPEIRPSAFHVTKRLFDLLESGPKPLTFCKCMDLWRASENCQIVLYPWKPEERPAFAPGKYNMFKSIGPNMNECICQHCQKDCGNPIDLLKHCGSEHLNRDDKIDGIFCGSPLCADRSAFASEDLLKEHVREFHKVSEPDNPSKRPRR